jgi:hypothetical protein
MTTRNRPKSSPCAGRYGRHFYCSDQRSAVSAQPMQQLAIGSEYLLKITPITACSFLSFWRSALVGFPLEKPVYCACGIASYDKPFLFRSALAFRTLAFWFLRHLELSYRTRRMDLKLVPQPGLEPGCPEWARDCKSRSYAISDTGGNAGTVTAVPASSKWWFIRFGVILRPSPRNIACLFVGYFRNFCLFGQSRQHRVNGRGGILLRGQIESFVFQKHDYVCRGYSECVLFHDFEDRVCNAKFVKSGGFAAQRGERGNRASQPRNFVIEFSRFPVYLVSPHSCRGKGSPRFLQSGAISGDLGRCHGGIL